MTPTEKDFAETAAGVRRREASDVERVEDIASRKVAVTLLRTGALKCPQIWGERQRNGVV